MADLTTLSALKGYLGQDESATSGDSLLMRLVSAASAAFISETANPVLRTTYTGETYNSRDVNPQSRYLRLRQAPVESVTSVSLNGSAMTKRVAVGDGGWYQDGDGVRFEVQPGTAATWPVYGLYGWGDIAVTYIAGFATVPSDVEQAVLEMAATEYRKRDRLGITSRSVQGETISYLQYEYSLAVKMTIDNYSRVSAA